jgi:hypothetical protein
MPQSRQQVIGQSEHCGEQGQPEQEGLAIVSSLLTVPFLAEVRLCPLRGRSGLTYLCPSGLQVTFGVVERCLSTDVVSFESGCGVIGIERRPVGLASARDFVALRPDVALSTEVRTIGRLVRFDCRLLGRSGLHGNGADVVGPNVCPDGSD